MHRRRPRGRSNRAGRLRGCGKISRPAAVPGPEVLRHDDVGTSTRSAGLEVASLDRPVQCRGWTVVLLGPPAERVPASWRRTGRWGLLRAGCIMHDEMVDVPRLADMRAGGSFA